MSSSSLITSIHSALTRIEDDTGVYARRFVFEDRAKESQDVGELKIGLRSLKALLLVSRVMAYTGGHGCLNALPQFLMQSSSSTFADLLPRIQTVLDLLIHAEEIDAYSMAEKVHLLGEELDEELSWSCTSGICQSSSLLTADEVVGIIDSSLENAPGFLSRYTGITFEKQTDAFEAIDAFEVHVRFMRSVVSFAGRVGVELENVLMPHIQPIVISAARVFIVSHAHKHMGRYGYEQWCSEIGSRCLRVNRMATNPQVYQAYSRALCIAKLSSTSLNMGDQVLKNLLESLISLLWDALRHASNSAVKDEFKLLYERMRFLRAVLKHQATSLDEAISDQVLALLCDAGVLICSFLQPDLGRLSDLLQRFALFRAQVVASPTMMSQANDDFTTIDISHENEQASRVLGFHSDEVATVLHRLIGGSKHLRIVPVCGMAGLGKTTFALKLYNHPSVLYHFWARAWCPVSQELDKKKVLLQLLKQIQPKDYSDMDEDDLANKLRQSLKGRPYLILLDDIWSCEALAILKASFPDDLTGSRIILTSRHVNIAPHHLPDESPHLLRLRKENECLEILQKKLFNTEGWSNELGVEVAKICKGLPLTLVLISGLLATTKQQGWKEILDHFSSGLGVSGAEQCTIALELGYKHLPDYLKPCFLYFGAFPEDKEVSVNTLIRLWMAEGFVIKNELKRIEDVGREYMEKLIKRSLVMVEKNRSIGGAKSCRIHDLLHGFCQSKAKQEDLLHLLPTRDQCLDFNEPCNLQRLSVHSAPVVFKRLRLFYPGALSLLFFRSGRGSHLFDMSFIIQIFRLLKVLHMDEINLISGIPNEIGLLTQLTYLSFLTDIPILPSSVGNLTNLETFILKFKFRSHDIIAFPHTLWNLQNMKYLHIYGDFTLPDDNLEKSSSLLELETLRGVVFYGSLEKQLQKFPHIRRLKCIIRLIRESTEEELYNIVVPDLLTELYSLTMTVVDKFVRCQFGSTAENLIKLKLVGFELSREEIAAIGKFPNLEVLKLSDIHFPDHTLEMEGGEFPKLRFLELTSCSSLERWTTCDDDELPSLQKLGFNLCANLKEIPSWLETISTLQEIEVIFCSSALGSLVRRIKEVRKEYENSI